MKLRRRLQAVLIVAAILATASAALAAPIEIKVRTMLRERPTSSARILDRLPAGKKVPMLGRTDDGNWVHVRADGHEGWIQAAAVKGLRSEDDEASADADDEPARPLAKPRGVRPEAWVSKSRYHEGEELKLIVSVNEANLYGRPSNTGAVLGVLRRGEQVQLVKKSADKKWINIDIGGGETAWIEARTVKPGRVQTSTPPPDESAQEEAAPPPTITPEGAKKKAKLAKNEPPPAEEAPPPPKRRGSIEDETPPGLAPSQDETRAAEEDTGRRKGRKKVRKIASRDDSTTAEPTDVELVRDQWNSHGKVYIIPDVRLGFAVLSQRFTSNATSGTLTNYNAQTSALGAQIGFGIFGTAGKYLLFGGDASYTFAGIARYKVTVAGMANPLFLGTSTHTIDGGVSAGVHFGVLGGLSLRLRIGGQMVLNLVQPDVRAKLPSDRIVGMTIGLGLSVPALFTLAGHPFGVALYGGGLVPAQRAQTVGLEDGAQSTTFGGFFGGGLSFLLMQPNMERYKGQLALEAGYSYEFVATHYTGLSRRNNTITVADRGSAQHLISLGLGFYY